MAALGRVSVGLRLVLMLVCAGLMVSCWLWLTELGLLVTVCGCVPMMSHKMLARAECRRYCS